MMLRRWSAGRPLMCPTAMQIGPDPVLHARTNRQVSTAHTSSPAQGGAWGQSRHSWECCWPWKKQPGLSPPAPQLPGKGWFLLLAHRQD